MTKTEQMRRVILGLRIAIVAVVAVLVWVTIARCADLSQSDNGYTPSLVEGLFSLVIVLLSLYLNSLRNRIAKLENAPVVTLEVCNLKREKDEQVTKTLTDSTTKTEGHVEQIFEICNSIKVDIANLSKNKGG